MIYIVLVFFIVLSLILASALYLQSMSIKRINFFISRVIHHGSHTPIKSQTTSIQLKKLISRINMLIQTNDNLSNQYNKTIVQYQKSLTLLGHDFKTPATSILGYLELLSNTKINDEQAYYISIVQQRVDYLNHMIDQFFILSVLENERYPYQMQVVKPIAILQEHLLNYYEQLNDHFIDIQINLTQLDLTISTDLQALLRVYDNIIKNALDYGMTLLEISNNETTIYFKNIINPNATKQSTGFGLQIIEHFSKDLGFNLLIEQSDSYYLVTLKLS